ncbi:uncharacterized protein [Pocillopora verrucosa]|uniref:uncharacterized protein n=1 Tax=Pocillopora verrucosa TaxID=203993 RepID=UPI0033407CAB
MRSYLKLLNLVLLLATLWNSARGAVDGGWSGWTAWSGCAAGVCAGNQRIRTRTCTNPIPTEDGKYCDGDSAEQLDCLIDGGFTEWSQWSLCDNPCGGSAVNRSRTCTNPTPTSDGQPCSGDTFQTKLECISPCPTSPLDGGWSSWSPWETCSKTCGISGGSVLRRSRICNQPPPMNGGASCPGNDTEVTKACFTPCPVDGGFGLWSAWSACSETCGTGTQSRSRLCDSPVPANQGQNCSGDFDQAKSCKLTSCPGAVDGVFSTWSDWSTCTEPKYCLQGHKTRTRTCTNPPPANGGDECVGLAQENKDCPTQADGCSVPQPDKPDKTAADPNSWIGLECTATEKFSATGAYKQNVPFAVYSSFSFIKSELESGWFAILIEPDDKDDYGKKNLTKVCFETVDPVTIKKVVDNIATYYAQTSAIPGWTKTDQAENVLGFSIWIDEAQALRKYEFQVDRSAEYVPISGYKMTDVRFSYYTEGNSQTFKAKGSYTLDTGNVFDTEVKKDVNSGSVYAKGKADSGTFMDMLSSFGINPNSLPDFFVNALKGAGLWDFTMKPVELLRKIDKVGVYRFTGSIDAGGVPIHVEVITGYRFGRPTFAVGFSFDSESFGALSEKLSGIGVDFLDAIGLELQIGVSFHPTEEIGFQQIVTDDETKYSKEPLHTQVTTTVPKGIFAAAQLVLPKDCKSNKMCEISKMILGPTVQFYITGQFEWKKIRIATGFANIRLWDGLYFHKLELYVEADWNETTKHIKLGFRADIKVPVNGEIERDGIIAPNNELFLFGVLEYDFLQTQVAGKLGMRGMWRKAYTIPWLSFGNIFVGLTYKVGAPIPVTGVQFGARVEFGVDCLIPADFNNDGHCFGGSAYIGVGEPQFFYASITALTLGKIIRLLGFTFQLPPPVAESGFPEGAEGSYSTADVDLRIAGGPYIYEGFMIKGRVNILGWEIYAHVKLSSNVVFVDLKPDPIDFFGIATITRSPSDSENGPWFYVDARKNPPFIEAYVEGYTSMLGISTYCRLNLTMTRMELLIQGNFLNLIKAEVFLSASYSLSFASASFYVRVTVDLSGINDALDAAAKSVKEAFDAAEKALADARQSVVAKKEECKRKMSLKCDNCKSLKCKQAEKNCKGFLDDAGKWIGGVVDAAGKWVKKTFKKIGKALAPVGKAIKKVFKGWRKKRELDNIRNEQFAIHLRRRRFISKVICEGLVGGGCSAVSSLCEGTCKLVDHLAKGLCNVLDVAIGFLKLTEAATRWVGKAINFILTAFRVKSILIEFALSTYASGGFPDMIFTAGVDLVIFGKDLFLAVSFNLRDPVGSLRATSDKSTEWYKDKTNQKDATDTETDYYDSPNPFVDLEMSEQFLIENQQSATDDIFGPCLYVDSKDDGALIKVTGCNETDERQNWAYTLKGQIQNTWSDLCIDTNGASQGSKLIQTKCDPAQDDQNFQCDLAVRSIKRRRANQCWTLGTTSLDGPGSLVHLGSLKCIHPSGGGTNVVEGNKLVIYAGCSESRLEFVLDNGNLKHTLSGKCVQPMGAIADGVALGLYSSCGGHQFSFTTGGSLQHVGSKKCVNTKSGVMLPANSDEIVLSSNCENSAVTVNKEHLKFSFIPTDPYIHLDKCGYFDAARLDQRFEVMDESILSICSKFSKNLAYKKTTEQSSTNYNGFSSRAVDEVYTPYYDSKSCMHTKKEQNPWWRVDLGREYIVTDVMIVNRYYDFEKLTNFDVRVGVNKDNLQNPTCSDRVRTVGQGQALRLQCDPPIPGRYVSVQMFGEGELSMCEVTVYSRVGVMADLCQLDNGGCSQVCYNLCNLKVQCGCWPGYTLAYDSKTCIDKDECQTNNGGCDIANGLCVNTPGSYHCRCKLGYQLQENSEVTCEDFNECQLNNAGCEHICANSEGSYNCDCRKGFKLKDDKFGCEDIDECAEPDQGGCETKCSNYEGGYYCTCDVGYRLRDDGKTCEEIYCPALEAPFRGQITPETCTDDRENIQRNTQCTYGCVAGHNLAGGDQLLTCQIDGLWQGTVPYCKPVTCPKLTVPDNGGVIPASCSKTDIEYGIRCVFYCDDGYALSGPRYTTCQADQSWSELASLSCVRVYTDPWIACPIDRVEDLDPDKSTVVLGFKWQLPRTNMKNVTVSPSNYDENYPFPVGRHTVTWIGTSDSGAQKSCTFHITVNDVTPPQVQNCPASIVERSNSLQKDIFWTEPTFTDNVEVATIQSNRQPGFSMQTYTSLTVQYTASDAAGNTVYCTFNITLEGTTCPTIPNPKNGLASKLGLFLQLRCNTDYFFNPYPPGLPGLFQNPFYRCIDNKWVSQNDFVSILHQAPDCMKYVNYEQGKACGDGTILLDNVICLNCPPGSYGDSSTNTCKDCHLGYYQDEEGKPECQPCPKNYSTAITGAKNRTDCRPICRPGRYSTNNGVCPCKRCPYGTYQEIEQMTYCKACPMGTNTTTTGRTSIDDCVAKAQIIGTVPTSDFSVKENDTISIVCNVDGSPAPTATWTKTTGSPPSSDRVTVNYIYDLEAKLTGVEYVITAAIASDAGTYECRASNKLNVVTKTIAVSVTSAA